MIAPIAMQVHMLPDCHGWASWSVRAGDQAVEIGPFSHALTDGMDDLLRAAVSMVCGGWEAGFSMDGEPRPRWTWRLVREIRGYGSARAAQIDVIITRSMAAPGDAGDEVFRVSCTPDGFGQAVLSAMHALIASEPPEALRGRWGGLPMRSLAALRAALSVPAD